MENFDRLTRMHEQQPIPDYETPPSQDNVPKARADAPFPKILSILLIVGLIATAIYTLLHPINKVKLKFFLFRNCTIQVEALGLGHFESKNIRIDGNLIMVGDTHYYEVDGDTIYEYVKTGKNTWAKVPTDEEWVEDLESGRLLLEKSSYKRVKGKLFTWRLKNSVAETVDGLYSINLKRDAGKIAIVGYSSGTQITMRFTRFGRTHIDPPWEEPGMIVNSADDEG